ncbi:uncharacterized protein [Musca autumnalis]|uniref:uncharacterized protein n=1 Tax=Musca autumnalis TaxID=221902 RepID=UPI003CF10253
MSNFNFDFDSNADEDFFGTLKGDNKSSKLNQLFVDDDSPEERDQSLKYKRPKSKDLRALNNDTPSSSSQTLTPPLLAKVVTAYKQGELQGKVGLALTKNPDNEDYSLILYKSKSSVLITLDLPKGSQLLFKQQNYWQFYDLEQHYWSFSFNAAPDDGEFQEKLLSIGHVFKESEKEKTSDEQIVDNEEETPVNDISDAKLPEIRSKVPPAYSKNSLIQRMAKMGGQPLPKLPSNNLQTTTEFSDSSDTEEIKTPLPPKPSIAPRNKVATLKNNQQILSSTLATFNPSMAYATNPMESQYMQMLLSEQRTQGSELRMNVSKLETKIEKVLDKLDLIERSGPGEGKEKRHRDDEILELEEKILNLKKENRKLKQHLENRTEDKDNFAEKSQEIVDEFREDLKEMDMGHIKDLRNILKLFLEQNKELKENVGLLQKKVNEMEKSTRQINEDLERIKTNNKQLLMNLSEEESRTKTLEEEKQQLITNYEEKIKDIKQNLDEKLRKDNEECGQALDITVKSIMNNLYADICDKLETNNMENTDKILAIVASSIKKQTLKTLQK